jgi:fructose-specific PTS system IIC-like component
MVGSGTVLTDNPRLTVRDAEGRDPLRVIPCIMVGSMVASTIAMLGGVGDHAPHGGPIVLPVVDHRVVYVVAIIAGMVVTALAINTLKALSKARQQEELVKESA